MKRITVFFLSLALISFVALSCSQNTLRVTRFDPANHSATPSHIYYLPQTVLNLRFTVDRATFTPGPYALYAERFLGIELEDIPAGDHWRIRQVELSESSEPDYHLAFAARTQNPGLFLKNAEEGYYIPATFEMPSLIRIESKPIEQSLPAFLDLSTEQFVADQQSIFYSTVQKDSTFVRVPVQRSVVVKQSLEEKAKQAADLIFALRKKRVELITGEIEMSSAPGAMERMLDEINRLEANYMRLFLGSWKSETSVKNIRYVPNPSEEMSILCRFSETGGMLPTSELSGTPIVIEITPLSGQSAKTGVPTKALTGAFYYRPPRMVEVSVNLSGEKLIDAQFPVAQFGDIIALPVQKK